MFAVGEIVRLVRIPDWVDELPGHSPAVFQACLGRAFPIVEIDDCERHVLDVSRHIDREFGGFMNDIRVEADYLEAVRVRPLE